MSNMFMSISINTVLRNKSLHNKHERKVQVELKYLGVCLHYSTSAYYEGFVHRAEYGSIVCFARLSWKLSRFNLRYE
jgi:hypothetical protein